MPPPPLAWAFLVLRIWTRGLLSQWPRLPPPLIWVAAPRSRRHTTDLPMALPPFSMSLGGWVVVWVTRGASLDGPFYLLHSPRWPGRPDLAVPWSGWCAVALPSVPPPSSFFKPHEGVPGFLSLWQSCGARWRHGGSSRGRNTGQACPFFYFSLGFVASGSFRTDAPTSLTSGDGPDAATNYSDGPPCLSL